MSLCGLGHNWLQLQCPILCPPGPPTLAHLHPAAPLTFMKAKISIYNINQIITTSNWNMCLLLCFLPKDPWKRYGWRMCLWNPVIHPIDELCRGHANEGLPIDLIIYICILTCNQQTLISIMCITLCIYLTSPTVCRMASSGWSPLPHLTPLHT